MSWGFGQSLAQSRHAMPRIALPCFALPAPAQPALAADRPFRMFAGGVRNATPRRGKAALRCALGPALWPHPSNPASPLPPRASLSLAHVSQSTRDAPATGTAWRRAVKSNKKLLPRYVDTSGRRCPTWTASDRR